MERMGECAGPEAPATCDKCCVVTVKYGHNVPSCHQILLLHPALHSFLCHLNCK